MNDRVLRHQAKFFDNGSDAILFWSAFFKIIDQRDYQISDYRMNTMEDDQSSRGFKVARMCGGYFNIISLSEAENYLWVGRLPSTSVKKLHHWINQKIQGDNSDNSNPFILLESFLRFNFNRRSANAMLNGLFAFFIKFESEIVDELETNDSILEELYDQTILEHCLSLLFFIRKTVLPRILSATAVKKMAEKNINAFPYVYTFEVTENFKAPGVEPNVAKLVSISSYPELPEWVVRMSLHRELDHAVNDCFMRYEGDSPMLVVGGGFIEMGHFTSRNVTGDLLYDANYKIRKDLKHVVTPCCLELKNTEHSCYLFDGLDVLQSMYLKVYSNPDVPNGINVDLKLVPINLSLELTTIVARIRGVICDSNFIIKHFSVDNPMDSWVLYAAEIEAIVAMYVDDLIDNEGVDVAESYDTIYIRERNIIQSRAEILNLDKPLY